MLSGCRCTKVWRMGTVNVLLHSKFFPNRCAENRLNCPDNRIHLLLFMQKWMAFVWLSFQYLLVACDPPTMDRVCRNCSTEYVMDDVRLYSWFVVLFNRDSIFCRNDEPQLKWHGVRSAAASNHFQCVYMLSSCSHNYITIAHLFIITKSSPIIATKM